MEQITVPSEFVGCQDAPKSYPDPPRHCGRQRRRIDNTPAIATTVRNMSRCTLQGSRETVVKPNLSHSGCHLGTQNADLGRDQQ